MPPYRTASSTFLVCRRFANRKPLNRFAGFLASVFCLCLLTFSPSFAQRPDVFAYEGFDYYNGLGYVGAVFNGIPQGLAPDRQTAYPAVSASPLKLHSINKTHLNTNSPYALGWAGDWIQSDLPPNNPSPALSDYSVGTQLSSTVSSADDIWSLVNTGFFASNGNGAGKSVGRRLQTSTAAYFYQYPLTTATPPNANSTLRRAATTAQAAHPSATDATVVGAGGTTIWMGFLMRIEKVTNELAYINLHRNANPYDDDANKVSVGYFGTDSNTGSDKFWSLKIGATVTKSAVKIVQNEFDLLVVGITFNYSGSQTVNLYVIKDGSTAYNNHPTAPSPDVALTTLPSGATAANDLSFHSVAYVGGSTGFFSSIDEIRFGGSFEKAALSSKVISTLKDLCQGKTGVQIYPAGNFGTVKTNALNAMDADEFVTTDRPYNLPYASDASGFSVPSRIEPGSSYGSTAPYAGTDPRAVTIIKRPGALWEAPSTTYNDFATGLGFVYRPTPPNGNSQPNDGAFYIGSQSRSPFQGSFSTPVWIHTYSNDGDKKGMMMVVNAAYNRSKFFERTVSNICAGTQYEFYLDIINLFGPQLRSITNPKSLIVKGGTVCDTIKEPGCGQFSVAGVDQASTVSIGAATANCVGPGCQGYHLNPEIEFLIDDVVVYIPPTSIANDEQWHRIGFTFQTKNVSSIKLAIRNRAPGGDGNDLAIDNISFRPCGPNYTVTPGVFGCSDNALTLTPTGKEFRKPFYQWQVLRCLSGCATGFPTYEDSLGVDKWRNVDIATEDIDRGINTLDLNGIKAYLISINKPLLNGDRLRSLVASENGANTGNELCRIATPDARFNCVVPLPVGSIKLSGMVTPSGVKLNWTTLEERNVRHFIVEKSLNGRDFEDIGTVAAEGNVSVAKYNSTDVTPALGFNYYRIRAVDYDGLLTYSAIINVDMQASVTIFPNPANDRLYVSLGENIRSAKRIQVKLTNLLGKVVYVNEAAGGGRKMTVPTSALPSGVYYVEVATDTAIIAMEKIVVSH